MNRMLDPYGLGYRPMMSDAEDVDTRSVVNHMMRNQAYDQSTPGQINAMLASAHAATPDAATARPTLPGTAMGNAGHVANFLRDAFFEGAKTANRWLGAPQFPEKVQTGDVLAPLGAAGMAAPFMPRNALGSAGGKLVPWATRDVGGPTHEAVRHKANWMTDPPEQYAAHHIETWDKFKSKDPRQQSLDMLDHAIKNAEADMPSRWNVLADRTGKQAELEYLRKVRQHVADRTETKGPVYDVEILADQSRSSVPGTVVNASGQEQDDPVMGILSRYGLLP